MNMAHRDRPVSGRLIGERHGGRRPTLVGLRLGLIVAGLGLAGCTSSTVSPSTPPSAVPSAVPTASASMAAKPTVAPSVAPTATATFSLTPTPTPSPTPKPTRMPKSVQTGSMHVARTSATATLLQNGKVLIAGGSNGGAMAEDIYASAELYDPTTGKFTKTGSMTAARTNQMATLLQNGRVLIAGGYGCSSPRTCSADVSTVSALASAELYDPGTGKFSPIGSMTTPSADGTATLLPDGRVLVAEGDTTGWADLYDPQSGKFTRAATELGFGFDHPSATLLPNGKVLVTGGDSYPPYSGALYDENSGKFTKISLEPAPGTAPAVQYKGQAVVRAWPGPVTVLKDGRVLLFEGGYLVTYDPLTGKCVGVGFISPQGLWLLPKATLLPDGRVLFVGGEFESADYTETFPTSAVVYNPSSGDQAIVPLKGQWYRNTSTLLGNGNVLIAADGDTFSELFEP